MHPQGWREESEPSLNGIAVNLPPPQWARLVDGSMEYALSEWAPEESSDPVLSTADSWDFGDELDGEAVGEGRGLACQDQEAALERIDSFSTAPSVIDLILVAHFPTSHPS